MTLSSSPPIRGCMRFTQINVIWRCCPDQAALRSWQLPPQVLTDLAGVPRTVLVTSDNAQQLWETRKTQFFKPAGGHGSKVVYRGDKVNEKGMGGDYSRRLRCSGVCGTRRTHDQARRYARAAQNGMTDSTPMTAESCSPLRDFTKGRRRISGHPAAGSHRCSRSKSDRAANANRLGSIERFIGVTRKPNHPPMPTCIMPGANVPERQQ